MFWTCADLNPLTLAIQIDFKTKMLCSIQKGIVKQQLPFSIVKSCDDGAGSRFSISFKGHHDYELEATSLEDKHKVSVNSFALKSLRESSVWDVAHSGDSLCSSRSFSLWIRSFMGTYTMIQGRAAQKHVRSLKRCRASGKVSCYSTVAAWRHSDGWSTDVSSWM